MQISLTSQQTRLARLFGFSLGSLAILLLLFSLSSSANPLSSPSLPSRSSSFFSSTYGIQLDKHTGLYRYSYEHPWIDPGKPRRRILAGSHFTAHEGPFTCSEERFLARG